MDRLPAFPLKEPAKPTPLPPSNRDDIRRELHEHVDAIFNRLFPEDASVPLPAFDRIEEQTSQLTRDLESWLLEQREQSAADARPVETPSCPQCQRHAGDGRGAEGTRTPQKPHHALFELHAGDGRGAEGTRTPQKPHQARFERHGGDGRGAEGTIPHGIYDLARNRGHINIGLSHDTSRFACDSFRWYWNRIDRQCYPRATSILWLCDGGGSNSATHYLFKRDLQNLVDDLGIEIRAAHYPSYCSKYNPIERCLFPHITRVCQGILFETLETVVGLMRKATTRTGLRTTVNVIRRAYEIGLKVADDFKETMRTAFDNNIPKWNYRVVPQ